MDFEFDGELGKKLQDELLRRLIYAFAEGHPNDIALSEDERLQNRESIEQIHSQFRERIQRLRDASTALERLAALVSIRSFWMDATPVIRERGQYRLLETIEIIMADIAGE